MLRREGGISLRRGGGTRLLLRRWSSRVVCGSRLPCSLFDAVLIMLVLTAVAEEFALLVANLSLVAMYEQWMVRFVEHNAKNLKDYSDWDHGIGVLVCWDLDT